MTRFEGVLHLHSETGTEGGYWGHSCTRDEAERAALAWVVRIAKQWVEADPERDR
jgi:hypothetical protein